MVSQVDLKSGSGRRHADRGQGGPLQGLIDGLADERRGESTV